MPGLLLAVNTPVVVASFSVYTLAIVAVGGLQAALQAALPDCDDVSRQSGFTPHLSVGQVRGQAALEELKRSLQEHWAPLTFAATHVSLVWRGRPPDDVFRVDRDIPLERKS